MEKHTIYSLWETLISRKSVGTSLSYQEALKRFERDNGMDVKFEDITPQFIDGWRTIMRKRLSKTSVNIYLRSFSAVVHYAYECQYIKIPPKFLFRGLNIFSPYGSNSRKHCYLRTSEWLLLWNFYTTEGEEYPQMRKWTKSYRKKVMEATGLMLFMYMANGMNLRDVLLLRYSKFYFQTGGTQLQYCRHKTAERTANAVEVPILPGMRTIIERLGQVPQEDALVFPYLNAVVGDELKEHKLTAALGHLIRDRMRSVAQLLQLRAVPTPTWARHSYATNLIQANVPKDYVSWAMGHTNNGVTNNYIASYSYEQMVEYNSLLLHPAKTCDHILSQVSNLSDEEREELMQKLMLLKNRECKNY